MSCLKRKKRICSLPIPTRLVLRMVIGQLNGGNGRCQYHKTLIRLVIPQEDIVGKIRKVLSGSWLERLEVRRERTCTIPEGKALLFAPVNVECSFAEFPDLKSEADLRECAKSGQDLVTVLDVSVDGVKLENLQDYRVQSPLFNLTLPESNVFGLPATTTEAVSDGNWVFLKPLPPGNHTIHSKGVSVDFTATGTSPAFVSDVIYRMTVG